MQPELVNLVWRHVSRGTGVDIVLVALLAIRQRNDRERNASLRRVFGPNELGEFLIGGKNVGIDGVCDLLGKALLIVCRNVGRIFLR
jgi:hypothetical protein